MSGPPLKIDIDENVTPSAVHTPIPVPVHWRKEIKAQLDHDVKLGVIEPVPWGEPTTWCSRMIPVAKDDGSPRRTIDLQALNSASVRQTHHTPSPFHQAMSVPHNTVKSVYDAWNGYNSLAVRDEDRHYTTFITPWGRYRYCVAPQGHLVSGDGYTERYDIITQSFPNYKRIVDDTCLYHEELEDHILEVCRYLSLTASHEIIQNEEKFQFAQKELEFVGFVLSENGIRPSDSLIDSIINFDRPSNISNIRSWFGLVEQVSFSFCKTEVMAPFRHLLSGKNDFIWTQELSDAFVHAKTEICKKIVEGVKTFEIGRETAVITDWSKTGIGFVLCQKFCVCKQNHIKCCKSGWRLFTLD